MKLLRYGPKGGERPALLDGDGVIRDLSNHIGDVDGPFLSKASLEKLRALDPGTLPKVEGTQRVGQCVANPGKVMCIGLNYKDHAAETGSKLPEHPMLFMKANSAMTGPDDDVVLPRGSEHTDWEVELAAVIGEPAKYVSVDEALDHVAGYCVMNDVSERRFQKHMSGQFTKGKSCDTFGPLGPWLVTADEIEDPQNLSLWCNVNGKRMQDGTTSDMIFSVAEIISHLSQMFTLHPGDIISTGTPAGVGAGVKPAPLFLKPDDELELGVEGLGVQHQTIVADG